MTLARIRLTTVLAALLVSGTLLAQSQQAIRDQLFGAVDQVKQTADAKNAKLLAPKAYAEGLELYIRATETLEKGKDLESVREDLAEATTHFKRADEAATLAQTTFANALTARSAAERAEAAKYVERDWLRAEESLVAAAQRLEGGNLNKAVDDSADVEKAYKEAESRAITAKTKANN
jgi:hypothetical protein